MSVLEHVFAASLCHIRIALSVELQPYCTREREKRLMEIMREREREGGRQASRQTKTEGERQSDSKGSRGWWLPWGAMSGWRRVSERDGGRVIEGAREAAM